MPLSRHEHADPTHAAFTSHIRHPRAAGTSYSSRQVATAYGCPTAYDGTGMTVGVIELGGAVSLADLKSAGSGSTSVTVVLVDGGKAKSDGPNGADGEVALDVQVIASVAPGAKQRVYFAPNTDTGFIAAVKQASTECDLISISWGGPESSWSTASVKAFSAVLASARAKGVTVFVAAGDSGSRDGTSTDTCDYPASDPSVIGCGGTRLTLNADGTRATETVWDDNDTSSATGGGVSKLFPGRTVPDVAGNADPVTGYTIVVDKQTATIGGTSAVAPLYAAMTAVLRQAFRKPFDFLNTVSTNPTVCFDVLSGDNGGYRAGPGRDDTTGYGVLDCGRLLAVLTSGVQVPAPGGNPTPPAPKPADADHMLAAAMRAWLTARAL